MGKSKTVKKLVIKITGTVRKRKELERAVRTFLEDYEDRKGVYDITVQEENITYFTAK